MVSYRVASIQIMSNAALFGTAMFIPLLMKQEMGAGDFLIGLIVAVYGVSMFLSSYIFGRAADMHGRHAYIRAGLLVSGIACVIHIFTYDIATLAAARVILGFCGGIFPSALAAYAYEHHIKMGKFTSHSSMGFGVGSVAGSLIVLWWGSSGHALGRQIYNPVFAGCALMFLACFAIILTVPRDANEKKHSVPLIPKKIIKDNLSVYASLLIRHSGACAVWAFFSLFIYALQPASTPQHIRFFWIGVINGCNGLMQFVFMQFIDRYRSATLIYAGFILSALVFVLFIYVQDLLQLFLTQILLAAAWSCLYVGSITLVMEKNPEHATSAGLLGSTLNASQVLGPLLGGMVAAGFAIKGGELGGYRGIMFFALAMSLVAMLVFYMLEKRNGSSGSGARPPADAKIA